MVIALAGMQAQEGVAPSATQTPQANRSTNLHSSKSNRTVEPDAKPTPNAEEARAKGDTSKPIIQNIKARSGQASPTPGGRTAVTVTSTPGPQDATNLNSSKSNRKAQPTPGAPPR
jgi:hypothetical protein